MTMRWIYGVILLTACASSPPETAGVDSGQMTSANAAEPQARSRSLADVAPGDTAALVQLISDLMNDGDRALSLAERHDTTLPGVAETPPRPLTLWTLDGRLLKLVAGEVSDAGLMTDESLTWFRGGEISVVQEPHAVMLFDRDQLILLTDEGLEPVHPTEADRMALERAVVDTVKARLTVLGKGYP